MNKPKVPTQFGLFYPTGWIVAAFREHRSAEQVHCDLRTGGYDDDDSRIIEGKDVKEIATAQLQNASWLARLGTADEMLERHLAAADAGSAFLMIYAPSEEEMARVMNVVRRVPFEFAHAYRRLAIQDLR
jgi:hypothetical protein